MRTHLRAAAALALAAAFAAPAPSQVRPQDLDTVRAGRFDAGKMWTFEYAPADYFRETYGFDASPAWFERARLAALRIPGCSASFVSPHGLLATNHHCARGAVTSVSRAGENLLDSGFTARGVEEERRIPGLYADQLLAALDVSEEILAAADRARTDAERERARAEASAAVRARLKERYATPDDSIWVQIVSLYHGGRYSAYVFRRFTDVRLVVAAELQLGFFGGDADNFTYPRYALDFAFLRAYGPDGAPYRSEEHFRWGAEGVRAGEVVFVIGNPGTTSRLTTVAQLEYQRDVEVPELARFLTTRLEALRGYREANLAEAEALGVRNRMFGISNSLKATSGRLAALYEPVILARRRDAERRLAEAIAGREDLRRRYGTLFQRIAEVQRRKAALAGPFAAFWPLASPAASSAILRRAIAAHLLATASAESVAVFRTRLAAIRDQPRELERRLLLLQLADVARGLGPRDAVTRPVLGARSPEDAAAALLSSSALADSAATARALSAGAPPAPPGLPADDPGLPLAAVLAPRYLEFQREWDRLRAAERELAGELGRARFEVYGRDVPPDGTSSPRITDGIVRGYEYNGTLAPPFTTFHGMYDRFYAHGRETEWDLPARWVPAPGGLDLATPLNFVSTADTYGGNSGSPAVTRDLALVGLNFDRNIEGLSRDYIYLPERGRNIMVDARAIQAALDHVYDADRVVLELLTGRLFRTEEEADRAGR